jgi:hypothetical protein
MGEDETEWESFRAGFVDSLGAEGTVEGALAERAASLVWRLRRLVQYEATKTAVNQGGSSQVVLGYTSEISGELAVANAKAALASLKTNHEQILASRNLLSECNSRPDGEEVNAIAAMGILNTAYYVGGQAIEGNASTSNNLDILKAVGLPPRKVQLRTWTVGHVRRGLAYYGKEYQFEEGEFLGIVARELDKQVEFLSAAIVQAEATVQETEIDLGNRHASRRAAEALLSTDEIDKIIRYEAHLGRQLQQTLTQLERMQSFRRGERVAPAIVAELGVSIASEGN